MTANTTPRKPSEQFAIMREEMDACERNTQPCILFTVDDEGMRLMSNVPDSSYPELASMVIKFLEVELRRRTN
jgi:hypothetical protein